MVFSFGIVCCGIFVFVVAVFTILLFLLFNKYTFISDNSFSPSSFVPFLFVSIHAVPEIVYFSLFVPGLSGFVGSSGSGRVSFTPSIVWVK